MFAVLLHPYFASSLSHPSLTNPKLLTLVVFAFSDHSVKECLLELRNLWEALWKGTQYFKPTYLFWIFFLNMTPHSPLISAWWDSRWGDLQDLTSSCTASAQDTCRWLGASATLLLACFAEGARAQVRRSVAMANFKTWSPGTGCAELTSCSVGLALGCALC